MRNNDKTHLGIRDLLSEAVSGVLQRPSRSALTMLGTVLGIGSFVTILGLSETASAQISRRFSVLEATTVTVEDVGPTQTGTATLSFPEDADQRIQRLNGVTHAGVFWRLPRGNTQLTTRPEQREARDQLDVFAASPGLLNAAGLQLSTGTVFNRYHAEHNEQVALIGRAAARQIGISRVDDRPAVFINGDPYTVIGIIDDSERLPELTLGVTIPDTVAVARYGPPQPDSPAQMIIATQLGAAPVVADQAAVALRPDAPQLFKTIEPPDPRTLRESVSTDVNGLFLALAAVAIVVGAVGIANTTLVAILERTSEIGLRRSLGARPRHIAMQFLTEAALLGAFGGLIGASTGVLVVIVVSVLQDWTSVIDPLHVLPAPLVGAAIGLLAGLFPAIRASRIEPATAMRQ